MQGETDSCRQEAPQLNLDYIYKNGLIQSFSPKLNLYLVQADFLPI